MLGNYVNNVFLEIVNPHYKIHEHFSKTKNNLLNLNYVIFKEKPNIDF